MMRNSVVTAESRLPHLSLPRFVLCTPMSHFSAAVKHAILLEYQPRSATQNFAALAQRHGVKGGARVVRRWRTQWNGTPASLEEKLRSGRPLLLSAAEVSRHIRAPLLAANRAHRAVHYTDLVPKVGRKTRKDVSLRTVQRYGKQQLHGRDKHTTKRTSTESECTHSRKNERAALCAKKETDRRVQCPLICVSRLLIYVAR
jgi:hypothetical protein